MAKSEPRWITVLTEYVPLAIFFGAYKLGDLTLAIQAIVVVTVIAAAVSLVVARRLPVLTLLAGGFVVAFGGASLVLGDDRIYMMKPTIVFALFAAILLVAQAAGRVLLKSALGDTWKLTDEGWRKLTYQYAGFFVAMAALNEVVWRTCSEDTWVNYKVFGGIGLTVLFTVSRVPFIQRHSLPEAAGSK